MALKYFGNRQNGTCYTEEELDHIFKTIADYFSFDWIKSNRSHPLQLLWNRRDALATSELCFFGTCLRRLALINTKWVKSQVKIIKEEPANNRQGAFFEINGLGILSGSNQVLNPALGNNPGYDGIFSLTADKKMRVSLKNYGDSSHCREFLAKAKELEDLLLTSLSNTAYPAIQFFVDCKDSYPDRSDWDVLKEAIPSLVREINLDRPKVYSIGKKWVLIADRLNDDYQEFHPSYKSYQLILSASFHKNEEKNLLSKLDDACSNLVKHCAIEDANIVNAIFIHLSEAASITACQSWIENFFIEYPDKPISCVILYQPTVSTDLTTNKTYIHHCFRTVIKEQRIANWNPEGIHINLELPVGKPENMSSRNVIHSITDGEVKTINFDSKYVFQKGKLFLQQREQGDGSKNGNIKQVASGISAYTVFEPFPGQGSVVIGGHFPPTLKLSIL